MRKFTLFLTLFFATAMTMFAQDGVIDLTFNKVSATEATVNVASETLDVTSITADIKANYDWKSLTANNETFPNASILCPDKNTNSMSAGNEGIITLTLNNVPAGYTFNKITFTSAAINGAGEFQGDDVNAQHVNFTLKQGDKTLGTAENVAIKVDSNKGQSVVIPFEMTEKCTPVDGKLELQLILSVTESKGCFYGLVKVSLDTTVEKEAAPLTVVSVTPTETDVLSVIEIEFSEDIVSNYGEDGKINLRKSSVVAAITNIVADGKILRLTLDEPITEAATYGFTISKNKVTSKATGVAFGGGNYSIVVTGPAVDEATVALVNSVKEFLPTVPNTVGYPSEASRAALQAALATAEATPTAETGAALKAVLNDFISTEDIILPEAGKSYAFQVVYDNETKYVLNNDNGVLSLVTLGEQLPETAIFVCEVIEGDYQFQFKTKDGAYYLAYPTIGGKSWLDNESETGLEADGTMQVTKFNVAKILAGNKVEATNEDLFGLVKMDGYRGYDNGKAKDSFGPIVVKHSAGTFDGADVPFYNSNFTSAFCIAEVLDTEVDYTPSFTGAKTRSDRNIAAISLTGEANGEFKYALDATAQALCYVDATETQIFKVAAGEEVLPVVETNGSWVHFSVLVDADANGFTAGIAEGSDWQPTGDLVSYSFYNNGAASDEKGWNSVGDVITGNDRNKPALPAFVAPTVPGTYRMRYHLDWCSIDPMGDQDGKFGDFMGNGGQIIDVTLEVVENIKPLVVTSIAPEANATVESLEQIVVTFDKEVASVDASMISVAEVAEKEITPIEAYEGNWNVKFYYPGYTEYDYYVRGNITIAEVDGEKVLKCKGFCDFTDSHDDTFIMQYDEATGNVIMQSQEIEDVDFYGTMYKAGLYMASTETYKVFNGSLTGNIVDGKLVFEKNNDYEYTADSFMFYGQEGGTGSMLSYFGELTWTRDAAAAPAKAKINNFSNIKLINNIAPSKAAKSAAQVSATVNGNQVVITVNGELADGAYKLTIAEGAVVAADGGVNEAIEAVYNVVAPEPEPTYEYNDGYSNHSERAFKSFTVTDGTNSVAVTDIQNVGKTPIYHDKTACVLETTAGARIHFTEFNYLGVWMHAYAYIDYNNDYTFGQDLNADGTTGGELVTYNWYSQNDSSTGFDSWGNAGNQSNANHETYYDEDFNESKGLPHFFLPADLAAGDYRMRIKVDWNNLDPVKGSKDMVNGGCEIDFIVRVAEAAAGPLTVAAITPEAGLVESIEKIVVTFDNELASVDASKISVASYKYPIEAYAGKWEVTSVWPGTEITQIANIEIVEVEGVQRLKVTGLLRPGDKFVDYDATFYMDYVAETGTITLMPQELNSFQDMPAGVYGGVSSATQVYSGALFEGKISDGNLVFVCTNGGDMIDSFILCAGSGSLTALTYFNFLTWTPATDAAAAVAPMNVDAECVLTVAETIAPAKAAKAEEAEAIEVSASVNGNELIITTNVAANGNYQLVIAEGAVVAANGATNEAIEAVYEVYKEPTTVVSVTPAKAVTELDVIEIEYNVEIAGKFDVMGMTQIYVGSKSNGAAYEVNGKVLTIDLFNSITTPGDYALHIPAGLITRVSDGSDVTCNGEIVFTVKEPGYEYVEGNITNGSRRFDSFTITDGTNEVAVTEIQTTTSSAVFADKTANVLETTAGAYISFTEFNFEGQWMHAYGYIDYNNDFNFDQVANADGTTGGELVTYNFYRNGKDSGDGWDIWGNIASAQYANSEIYYDEDFNESKGLPQFYLPADLAVGDYRMRIKIDWDNLDPMGDSAIKQNGGCQVDFIIRVGEATGIENVEVENGAQVIYDLTGRKVENANVRGIYIINGKKVLVK